MAEYYLKWFTNGKVIAEIKKGKRFRDTVYTQSRFDKANTSSISSGHRVQFDKFDFKCSGGAMVSGARGHRSFWCLPSFPFRSLRSSSFFPLPLEVEPLDVDPVNSTRGSGEHCKLYQWGLRL